MQTIVIIGGAGYIGSYMTSFFLEKGYKVKLLDNYIFNNKFSILPFINHPRLELIEYDIRDHSQINSILEKNCIVIILAGLVGDPITKKYPKLSEDINNTGILNLIEKLNNKSVQKLVFVSTCSNYGLLDNNLSATEETKLNPLSLYAKSKVECEKLIISLKGKTDYSPVILRFSTAFGHSPRMRFDLTVNEFTRDIAINKFLQVYDADTWRPYCHVKDFTRLANIIIDTERDKIDNQIFNAGGENNNFTKRNIVDLILNHVPDAKIEYGDKGSDPRNYKVNFNKVRDVLNFDVEYSVEDGIIEILDFIKQGRYNDYENNKNLYGNYEIEKKFLDE